MSILTTRWRSAFAASLVLVTVGVGAISGTASAATVDPEVWAGSPVKGTWHANATTHHWLANASDQGDWASDIAVGGGTPVKVYLAPQKSGYTVTARVIQIGAACRSGNGASFVTVGVYTSGRRIGSITYAHVRPSVKVGQGVNRWGAVIGTVASGLRVNSACWTGPHVHLQMYNVHNYSCFNKGYRIGSRVNPTNFVGFTGGHRVSAPRRPCP